MIDEIVISKASFIFYNSNQVLFENEISLWQDLSRTNGKQLHGFLLVNSRGKAV
jgi:hypothetical protein